MWYNKSEDSPGFVAPCMLTEVKVALVVIVRSTNHKTIVIWLSAPDNICSDACTRVLSAARQPSGRIRTFFNAAPHSSRSFTRRSLCTSPWRVPVCGIGASAVVAACRYRLLAARRVFCVFKPKFEISVQFMPLKLNRYLKRCSVMRKIESRRRREIRKRRRRLHGERRRLAAHPQTQHIHTRRETETYVWRRANWWYCQRVATSRTTSW